MFEPGLPELLQQAGGKLTATEDTRQAVAKSDATFVIVPPTFVHFGDGNVADLSLWCLLCVVGGWVWCQV